MAPRKKKTETDVVDVTNAEVLKRYAKVLCALNMRSEKVIKKDNIIEVLPIGTELEVLEEKEEWCKVKTNDKEGFVMAEFIDIK